jgi:hypothetical protein
LLVALVLLALLLGRLAEVASAVVDEHHQRRNCQRGEHEQQRQARRETALDDGRNRSVGIAVARQELGRRAVELANRREHRHQRLGAGGDFRNHLARLIVELGERLELGRCRARVDGDDAEACVLAAQAADELADVLLGVAEAPNGIGDARGRPEPTRALLQRFDHELAAL